MISLAARDIMHAWGRFLFTGLGLGLLVGVTLSMAGIYRGMVDDAKVLLDNSGADLWLVQKDTIGPYAEPSSIDDDIWREIVNIRGVRNAANVTYLTIEADYNRKKLRFMLAGIAPGGPGTPGWPLNLIAGRHISQSHYEAVADISSGLKLDETIKIRRREYRIVGLTKRMVSSSGDPMLFIPLKDAQEVQFLKDNEAIIRQRRAISLDNKFEDSSSAQALIEAQSKKSYVNAILVQLEESYNPYELAALIRAWKHLSVYSNQDMEDILLGRLIATSAKQIAMFLIILSLVSSVIISFIIYTLTLSKIREIAVLKLIGTKNSTIMGMIVKQALLLGLLGFLIGRISAGLIMAPIFPKYVLLEAKDSILAFFILMLICIFSCFIAIRAALKVDPAEAIGG